MALPGAERSPMKTTKCKETWRVVQNDRAAIKRSCAS